ncbi:hypothetical protein [Thioalkalivibrio sulfidiphilus]|uniref:hypothetical protein n=1 Tax=Thioalkalivibrio sulfidiphilus TaxID=1033854 RepID=UPI00037EA690|nr:hypothetical protein [Thioalkalivibrio sulfidiphilus]
MNRILLSLAAPPLAVCHYGCARRCAAPIGAFWLTGIVGLVYGGLGGPINNGSAAWWVVGIGVLLWGVAAVWTLLTVQGVDDDRARVKGSNRLCQALTGSGRGLDESDPLEEVERSRREE